MSLYFTYANTEPVPFRYLTVSRFVGRLQPPYKTTALPSDYLEFAIADLAEGSPKGLVNAFGNVKRALHFEVDYLLQQYGLFRHFGHRNFPAKLEVLDEIGLLPITLLSNLNFERNLIEHEYEVPTRKRVAEAIDVLKLLLFATEKLMEMTPYEVVLGWRQPSRHILLQLEPFEGELRLFTLTAKGKYQKIAGENCFSGQLRSFAGGELMPGIKISKRPWKIFQLNKSQAVEWRPILKEFVNVQRINSAKKTHINPNQLFATISVTVPFAIVAQKTWAQILDEKIKENFKNVGSQGEGKLNSQITETAVAEKVDS